MASNWNWRLPTAESLARIRGEGYKHSLGKVYGKALRKHLEAYVKDSQRKPLGRDLLEEADNFLSSIGLAHGVESLYPEFPSFYYVNLGDTYDSTLLYNGSTGNLYVGAWGDFVEKNSREYK